MGSSPELECEELIHGSITLMVQNEGCVSLLSGKEGFPSAPLEVILQWDVCAALQWDWFRVFTL